MIQENLKNVRRRIEDACSRSGRDPSTVTLVAVSKTFDSAVIRTAHGAGISDFGENYIQELREKREILRDSGIRWHFVGHLQTNKIKYIAGWVHLIHSVDSLRLAGALSAAGERAGREIAILVEVNTTGEKSKFGVAPEEAVGLVKEIRALPALRTAGLMTMGPMSGTADDSRAAFRTLAGLNDMIRREGIDVTQLSMGMTGDFEVAIEEGATIIRVGTAIFGGRTVRPLSESKGGS